MLYVPVPEKIRNVLGEWVLEQSYFGIIVTDEELNVILLNNWFKENLPHIFTRYKDKNLLDLFPNIKERKLDQYYLSALTGKPNFLSQAFHHYLIEIPLLSPYENIKFHQQNCEISPLFDKGKIIGTITRIENITDRIIRESVLRKKIDELKDAEQKLVKYSEELLEANIARDKMLSILAHDLKGPFYPLKGMLDIIIEDYNSFSDKELEDNLKEFQNRLIGYYALVENLLNWATMQRKGFKFNPTTFLLNELIENVRTIFHLNATKKNISINVSVAEDIFLTGDKDMIFTLLRNLLGNAIKFTSKGGSVKISAQVQNENIILSVEDTGIGIPKEKIDKLFKLSEISSVNGTDGEKGTGLGLLICKEIVDLHKGKINVISESGKGTNIICQFPKDIL